MDVTPTPTDEEAAAIAAALAVTLAGGAVPPERPETPRWRFAGRWWTKPIPVRRDRPW
jgi:hypothetical protein